MFVESGAVGARFAHNRSLRGKSLFTAPKLGEHLSALGFEDSYSGLRDLAGSIVVETARPKIPSKNTVTPIFNKNKLFSYTKIYQIYVAINEARKQKDMGEVGRSEFISASEYYINGFGSFLEQVNIELEDFCTVAGCSTEVLTGLRKTATNVKRVPIHTAIGCVSALHAHCDRFNRAFPNPIDAITNDVPSVNGTGGVASVSALAAAGYEPVPDGFDLVQALSARKV